MAITLVVDAYNAINKIPKAKKEMKRGLIYARKAIVDICSEYVRSSGFITDLKVVFDGQDMYRYLDTMDLSRGKTQVFSSTGRGDDKIIEIVRVSSKKGRVVLASNDNYVRNNSRVYGASLLNVESLVRKKKSQKLKESESQRSKYIEKNISQKVKSEITMEYKKELGIL